MLAIPGSLCVLYVELGLDIVMVVENSEYILNILWQFIRGDLSIKTFEAWVYKENNLENFLSKELYLVIIESNYKNMDIVFELKSHLSNYLRNNYPSGCKCLEISDNDVLDMGLKKTDEFFSYLKNIKDRGNGRWWLFLAECTKCNEAWLVAQEERHNDIYCLKRLSENAKNDILNENKWPPDFDKFESLLSIGFEAGKKVRFFDPINSSIEVTIIDIVNEHPGINFNELIRLLNIDTETGKEIIRNIEKKYKLNLVYD